MSNYCRVLSYAILAVLLCACGKGMPDGSNDSVPAKNLSGESARQWMALVYDHVRDEGLSPPVASRTYAYAGIMLYEATLGGMEGFRTLQDQLTDFQGLPLVDDSQPRYDWVVVSATAMATLLPEFFVEIDTFEAIRTLQDTQIKARQTEADLSSEVVNRSRQLGADMGIAVLNWIDDDGYAAVHDLPFSPPDGDHAWVPTAPGQRPLVPNWSTMRPLALSSSDACQPPPPIPFSTHRDSEFFRQAKEVYDTTMNLSDEEIEIALFWSDDPGATGTPAGHWVSIANSIVSDLGLSLDRTVEMYALLGIAGADAFISCWDEKYRSYLVRPVTYIQEHIDSSWDTLLVTPSFPEYTSGHSNISGASAMVLTSLFGALPFDDDLHAGRGLPSRSFASFTEAAQEAAISRLYGGIHYPMGIELGVKQGQCVGRNVMNKVRTRQLR